MKQNWSSILKGFGAGLLVILILGFEIYYKYYQLQKNMVTVFQIGVYQQLAQARVVAQKEAGIIHHDQNYYRVYVAAYHNPDIISKMEDYYQKQGLKYYLRRVKISPAYLRILTKYEKMLAVSQDESIYPNLNWLLITKFEEYLKC